jgi:hypothetical protein
MNRTLLERTRAMLKATSLGKPFWPEAVKTACYVINRSSSTATELKTPMEMWTGKVANYSQLYIFGSPMYARERQHDEIHKVSKLLDQNNDTPFYLHHNSKRHK